MVACILIFRILLTTSSVTAGHHELPLHLRRPEEEEEDGQQSEPSEKSQSLMIQNGYSLYERRPLKVLDGFLAELRLDVIGPEPLDHLDVGGEVPEGLQSEASCQSG